MRKGLQPWPKYQYLRTKLYDIRSHNTVAENCALLGYYAASSGYFLPTFQDIGPILWDFWILDPEDRNRYVVRNVGKKLPPLAA